MNNLYYFLFKIAFFNIQEQVQKQLARTIIGQQHLNLTDTFLRVAMHIFLSKIIFNNFILPSSFEF